MARVGTQLWHHAPGTATQDPGQKDQLMESNMSNTFEPKTRKAVMVPTVTFEATHRTAKLDLDLDVTHLISSPYQELENQLQLSTLEDRDKLFAFALTRLRPVRDDYAIAPYIESFNWTEVFARLRELCEQTHFDWARAEFYVVIFRSRLRPDIDRKRLGMLDQKSHEEACASGGLLKYWFGSPDLERRNLATCEWQSREEFVYSLILSQASGAITKTQWLVAVGHGTSKLARRLGQCESVRNGRARVRLTSCRYDSIDFFTHKLVVEDGANAWRLEEHS